MQPPTTAEQHAELRHEKQARLFAAVCTLALPEHRSAAGVVDRLAAYVRAARHKNATPYFTHCAIAKQRGRQNRTTSRLVIRRLADLGFLKVYEGRWHQHGFNQAGRTGCVPRMLYHTRFNVRWGKVYAFAKAHGLTAFSGPRITAGPTVDEWAAGYAEHQARRQAEAEAAHKARQIAEKAARAAADAEAEQNRADGLAAYRAKLRAHEAGIWPLGKRQLRQLMAKLGEPPGRRSNP